MPLLCDWTLAQSFQFQRPRPFRYVTLQIKMWGAVQQPLSKVRTPQSFAFCLWVLAANSLSEAGDGMWWGERSY